MRASKARTMCEEHLMKNIRAQKPPQQTNNSTPNILVAKKCDHCSTPLYVHNKDGNIIFSGCEPCLIKLCLDKQGNEILIKAHRSTKRVRCSSCKRIHLLSTFGEVKDGISKA